jgi:hypothetical protein
MRPPDSIEGSDGAFGSGAATGRRRLPTTILELDPSQETRQGLPLAPGMRFRGHRVLSMLQVASAEADLWLAEAESGGAKHVIKHYRHGVRPKPEILRTLSSCRREHVIGVVDFGEAEGRWFEVQEYLPEGTLADFVGGRRVPDPEVRVVVRQIAQALAHLQEFKVLHRDLKPSNILLRSREPLDLVLTDFGISSVADFSIHLTTVSRTAAYSAPESITGVVSRASDWWSLGVIVLELLTGGHPLGGKDEAAINQQLAGLGIAVPGHLPADWQLLLRGLLTRDHLTRWGSSQVERWLAGDRDIPVTAGAPAATGLASQRPYRFEGRDYFEPAGLAEGFVMNWPEAAKHLEWGYLTRWLQYDLRDQPLASRVAEILSDSGLRREHRLGVVLLALHAGLPLAVQGVILDESVCVSSPPMAAAVAESTLGTWLRILRGESWLEAWSRSYRDTREEVLGAGMGVSPNILSPLLVAPEAVLEDLVSARKQVYAGARDARLASWLRKASLTRTEAILFVLAPASQFLSRSEVETELQLERLRSCGWWIEERLARTLIRHPDWQSLAPRWIVLRQHWAERRRTPIPLAHPGLKRVINQPTPEAWDAISVLANRLEFRNSLGMRFVPVPGTSLLASVWQTRCSDFDAVMQGARQARRLPHFKQAPDHPVVWVTHVEATQFCNQLSVRDRAAGLIGPQDRYRLPSDLEWSRMAGLDREPGRSPRERNGRVESVYPWGTEWPPPADAGNTGASCEREPGVATMPAGSFPPNDVGLCDLGTQVMEWCADVYDSDTELRVVRGGSWCHATPENFLLSMRRRFVEEQASENLGFRCVLEYRFPTDSEPNASEASPGPGPNPGLEGGSLRTESSRGMWSFWRSS